MCYTTVKRAANREDYPFIDLETEQTLIHVGSGLNCKRQKSAYKKQTKNSEQSKREEGKRTMQLVLGEAGLNSI